MTLPLEKNLNGAYVGIHVEQNHLIKADRVKHIKDLVDKLSAADAQRLVSKLSVQLDRTTGWFSKGYLRLAYTNDPRHTLEFKRKFWIQMKCDSDRDEETRVALDTLFKKTNLDIPEVLKRYLSTSASSTPNANAMVEIYQIKPHVYSLKVQSLISQRTIHPSSSNTSPPPPPPSPDLGKVVSQDPQTTTQESATKDGTSQDSLTAQGDTSTQHPSSSNTSPPPPPSPDLGKVVSQDPQTTQESATKDGTSQDSLTAQGDTSTQHPSSSNTSPPPPPSPDLGKVVSQDPQTTTQESATKDGTSQDSLTAQGDTSTQHPSSSNTSPPPPPSPDLGKVVSQDPQTTTQESATKDGTSQDPLSLQGDDSTQHPSSSNTSPSPPPSPDLGKVVSQDPQTTTQESATKDGTSQDPLSLQGDDSTQHEPSINTSSPPPSPDLGKVVSQDPQTTTQESATKDGTSQDPLSLQGDDSTQHEPSINTSSPPPSPEPLAGLKDEDGIASFAKTCKLRTRDNRFPVVDSPDIIQESLKVLQRDDSELKFKKTEGFSFGKHTIYEVHDKSVRGRQDASAILELANDCDHQIILDNNQAVCKGDFRFENRFSLPNNNNNFLLPKFFCFRKSRKFATPVVRKEYCDESIDFLTQSLKQPEIKIFLLGIGMKNTKKDPLYKLLSAEGAKQKRRDKKMNEFIYQKFAPKLLEALGELERESWVHGGISLERIFADPNSGHIRIATPWEPAKIEDQTLYQTNPDRLKDNPTCYDHPALALGNGVGFEQDLYSAGVTLMRAYLIHTQGEQVSNEWSKELIQSFVEIRDGIKTYSEAMQNILRSISTKTNGSKAEAEKIIAISTRLIQKSFSMDKDGNPQPINSSAIVQNLISEIDAMSMPT